MINKEAYKMTHKEPKTKYVRINHNMDNTDYCIINVVGTKNEKAITIVFNYTWYKKRDGHQICIQNNTKQY